MVNVCEFCWQSFTSSCSTAWCTKGWWVGGWLKALGWRSLRRLDWRLWGIKTNSAPTHTHIAPGQKRNIQKHIFTFVLFQDWRQSYITFPDLSLKDWGSLRRCSDKNTSFPLWLAFVKEIRNSRKFPCEKNWQHNSLSVGSDPVLVWNSVV